MNTSYYFNSPAKYFEETGLIGNGKLGAAIYGGTSTERILLNNDTVYSGHMRGEDEKVSPDLYKVWNLAKEAMLRGDLKECRRLLTMEFNQGTSHKYLPLGNLYVDFGHHEVTGYRRSIDFETGISLIEYDCNGVHYTRESFASFKDNCIVLKFTSTDKMSFPVRFETELKDMGISLSGDGIVYKGMCPYDHDRTVIKGEPVYFYPEKEGESISFCQLVVPRSNGKINIKDGIVNIEDATRVELYLFSETSYISPYSKPEKDAFLAVSEHLDTPDKGYDEIKNAHIADFSSLFGRVKLSLGKERDGDISERIKNFDGTDTELYAILFNFGRYLAISSSREGSRAINLQGIWNSTTNPPWESTYTTNINLQMAYWHTLMTNLSETWEPLVTYVESMVPLGRETARSMYGAKGFVFHSNSDIWAHAYPCGGGDIQSERWSPWYFCSGWLCEQLFDGYEYTLDLEYLKRVYPLMKEASDFYEDMLVEDNDGKLMVYLCSSPENQYYIGDELFALVPYTAIGQSIVKELFLHTAEAAEILGVDDSYAHSLKNKANNLKWLETGSDGRLLEWDKEYKEQDIHHRHTSHVYGLYPGTTISVENTPHFADACRKSLEMRGDDGTGWGLAWKINLWALLRDGNHAVRLLDNQLKFVDCSKKLDYHFGGSYSNLLDAHPPFQIDGNFGSVAAICNMLMWSERGRIVLLPALPDKWSEGSIEGIVAKGNVKVSLWWKNGKAAKAVLSSPVTQAVTLCANGEEHTVGLFEGEDCLVEYLV